MFTGLIEATGHVVQVDAAGGNRRLRISAAFASELSPGESIAVNGVCLTAETVDAKSFVVSVSPETLAVTTASQWAAGRPVNLERPLRADGRLGGHFVLGHVDGVGAVTAVRADGDSYWVDVAFPASIGRYLVPKGSVALDGISLTIARLDGGAFGVQIVPFTWEHTALPALSTGDAVNLEVDIIGKYVERLLARSDLGPPGPAAGSTGGERS